MIWGNLSWNLWWTKEQNYLVDSVLDLVHREDTHDAPGWLKRAVRVFQERFSCEKKSQLRKNFSRMRSEGGEHIQGLDSCSGCQELWPEGGHSSKHRTCSGTLGETVQLKNETFRTTFALGSPKTIMIGQKSCSEYMEVPGRNWKRP